MSNDPAVRAATEAVQRMTANIPATFRAMIAVVAVEAARPSIEVEIADRVRAAYQRFLDTDDLDVLRDCLSELPWGNTR